MIRRKLVFGLVLVLGVACGKKSESKEETPEEAAAEGAETATDNKDSTVVDPAVTTDPAFLVGKWQSECQENPGFINESYYLQYEFAADGTASTKTVSYAAAGCTRRFTKPDVDALILQKNAERAELGLPPLSAAELVPYNDLWFPQPNPFTFKLAKTLKNGAVEMNVTLKDGVNNYLTVLVKDGFLYFSAMCSKADLDAQVCDKIIGDTVGNRATDLRKARPFNKI